MSFRRVEDSCSSVVNIVAIEAISFAVSMKSVDRVLIRRRLMAHGVVGGAIVVFFGKGRFSGTVSAM